MSKRLYIVAQVRLFQGYAPHSLTFTGQICCRFEDGSNYVRALGEFLRLQQTHDFQPYFEVEEVAAQRQTTKVSIECISN